MRISWTIVTLVACLHHRFGFTIAAPTRTSDEVLPGESDIAVRDDDSNEVTIKPFEKKCVVDGKTYSHAQAVSSDANSRCICVAGNVYCFWHGLPPGTDAPTGQDDKDGDSNSYSSSPTEPGCRNSSLPTETVDESPPPAPVIGDDRTNAYEKIGDADSNENDEDDDDDVDDDDDDGDDDDAGKEKNERNPDSNESTESTATTLRNDSPATPVTCVVLDRTYRVGEVLPHNTGNCVECSCGPEGHVVCAPRDCVSIVPHRDYREESFQIPVAGDLRGIDENF